MPFPDPTARLRRLPQLMLFAGFAAWYFGSRALAVRAASGLTVRFTQGAGLPLVEACCQLFLLLVGFLTLQAIARQSAPLRVLTALPKRPTSGLEWLSGAALGWGIVVVAVLPVILTGHLHAQFSFRPAALSSALITLATLGLLTLAHEIAFRGYPFRCLIEAVGTTGAVLLMVLVSGFAAWHNPYMPGIAVLSTMILTLLLSIAWLRTHAIWLAWGLHFALAASTGILFGLPVGGSTDYASVVQSSVSGPEWLTGGNFGLPAAAVSVLILLGAIIVLDRITRDFAWRYTHAPIQPAGYEVTIAPPAAHTAMETEAAKPKLVQILATTPQGISGADPAPPPPPPPPAPDRLH